MLAPVGIIRWATIGGVCEAGCGGVYSVAGPSLLPAVVAGLCFEGMPDGVKASHCRYSAVKKRKKTQPSIR